MKKMFLIIIFGLFIFTSIFSQDIQKFQETGKWGLKNSQGEIILKPNYDKIFDFTDDIAVIVQNGKSGYVNSEGKVIIKPQYQFGYPFRNGFAIVDNTKNKKYLSKYDVYSNKIGSTVYTTTTVEFENYRDIKIGVIDKTGKTVIPVKYKSIKYDETNPNYLHVSGLGLYDLENRKVIIPFKYGTITKYPKNNWYLLKEQTRDEYPKLGIFDIDAEKYIISPNKGYTFLDTTTLEKKGWIIVRTSKTVMGKGLLNYWQHSFGIIDWSDKVIIPLKYSHLDTKIFSSCERILVKEGLVGYGVIDYSGKVIIPLEYFQIELLSNRTFEATVFLMEQKKIYKKYFDLDGKELL